MILSAPTLTADCGTYNRQGHVNRVTARADVPGVVTDHAGGVLTQARSMYSGSSASHANLTAEVELNCSVLIKFTQQQ